MTNRMLAVLFFAVTGFHLQSGENLADLVTDSGVRGGLVVQLNCGNGWDTASLRLNERYLVQGLEVDRRKVQRGREEIRAKGLYGKVTIYQYDGVKLPYADNSVNLIVATGRTRVAKAEILRVLAPLGVAVLDGVKTTKPWPANIDQWTHYLRGPDNNAVAEDTVVGVPRSIQWVSGPKWGRSHEQLASMSTAVSANGRLFSIMDQSPLASVRHRGRWFLIARDAFNGIFLWQKRIPVWIDHLRHFRSGPVHLQRRLVAVDNEVYVTLGLGAPVTALDAATGELLRVYAGTEVTEEILVDHGVLYLAAGTSEVRRTGEGLHQRDEPKPSGFRRVMAVQAASGKILWQNEINEALLPLSLAVKGKRVCYQTASGVVCVEAKTGKQIWKTPRLVLARRMGFSAPTVVITDEVLLVADRVSDSSATSSMGQIDWGVHGWNLPGYNRKGKSEIIAYDLESGAELWTAPCKEGYNSPTDVFVLGDTVWVGTDFKGYKVKTGAAMGALDWVGDKVGMAHHRCYRDKATSKYLLTGRSGIEMVDFKQGWLNNNSWIRGTCQYGILPCNGLVYAPPDACACFLRVKVPGFFAAGTRRGDGTMHFPDSPVLEQGPAYGSQGAPPGASDWPMHRRTPSRSGYSPASVSRMPGRQWSQQFSGKLTQPVVANGRLLVAEIDAHTLYALEAASGVLLWHYTAGGRIDSAPTIHRGLVLFGAADGWIYALRLSDGVLSWRLRAAPEERLVQSFGQLESTWPVPGSVLVQNDVLYAAAGRVSYLDGGLVLYRLNPVTGQPLSRTVVYDINPKTDRQLAGESAFDMAGSRNDLLVGDGRSVFIKHLRFDGQGNRAKLDQPHLFAVGGFLEDDWFVRNYWVIGTMTGAGWGRWAWVGSVAPFGRILSITDDKIFGYGRQKIASAAAGHQLDAYHLFGMDKIFRVTQPPSRKSRGQAKLTKPAPFWSQVDTPVVRALLVAGDQLVIAGPPDLGKRTSGDELSFSNPAEALAAARGEKGALLQIRSTRDGAKVFEARLSSLPVFDGMSTANGSIYISLGDGTVACWK